MARKPDGGFERVFFNEFTDPADVTFESGVFLLLKAKAQALKAKPEPTCGPELSPGPKPQPESAPVLGPEDIPEPGPALGKRTFRISGDVPPEIWNRFKNNYIKL